jgi:predicted TIM-barrel fold metal-dependent hydrolase
MVGRDGRGISFGLGSAASLADPWHPTIMKIVDTHQHLIDTELFSYGWLKQVPALNRSFLMVEYLEAARGLEIEKSVFVEGDVDESLMLDETRYILRLADQSGNPLEGVVANARPESDSFGAYLDQISDHPKLKGIRRILHTQPDELGQHAKFIANVGSLASRGLSFDICVLDRQLPIAIALVDKCPGVNFILDHCGVPRVKEKVLDPWRADIRRIAQFPNVACKVSGIVAYADPEKWTADDLRPYVEHTIECFGWDRVMFGSDWPVCTLTSTFERWVTALKTLTQSAGAANQQKLFHDNAIRVYRLA